MPSFHINRPRRKVDATRPRISVVEAKPIDILRGVMTGFAALNPA